jgi:D-alanyl-D-alanine carboxypeptidase/D-alanyl-D-alanine-endopeptidase (penicillin-binding protein 4)
MMKLSFLILFLTYNIWAQDDLATTHFQDLVNRYQLGPMKDQSFCYLENNKLIGYRQNKLQRIASLTKLFTTFLASENLDLNKSFRTTFYISKDWLHIEGNEDPYFEEEKLLLLFKALNELGHHHFKKISFSEKFHFYDLAMGSYLKITSTESLKRLKYYLNRKNQFDINEKWKKVIKFAQEEEVHLLPEAPSLSADEVIVENNFKESEEFMTYNHDSKKLFSLLKTMNVQSKNFVSENVFEMASKVKTIDELLLEKEISKDSFLIKNGSGLPILSGVKRIDNLSTCETVLQVLILLVESIRKHNLSLSEVLAVNGGVDFGSFRDRFKDFPETFQSVLAKTGTLKNTSTLAGILLTNVQMPFAILNHTSETQAARRFQDHFVTKLFDLVGPPNPLVYQKISIFPWNETPFLNLEN